MEDRRIQDNNMITIHNIKQGSDAWHALRKDRWTGSRAIRLLQGKPLPDDSSGYENNAMRRGKLLESMAIREFERETGTSVLTVGFVENSEYPNAGYSPDGIIGDTLLEVKCLNEERHKRLISGDIPLEYLAQIHFGMVICELKDAKLLAFNPELPKQLTIIDIEFDRAIDANIRTKLKAATV